MSHISLLEKGLELNDMDREMLASTLEVAHLGNVPTNVVNGMLSAYFMQRDQIEQEMTTQDGFDSQTFDKVAKENWGADYETNMNRITNQFNMLPEAVREPFMAARFPNGMALSSSIVPMRCPDTFITSSMRPMIQK